MSHPQRPLGHRSSGDRPLGRDMGRLVGAVRTPEQVDLSGRLLETLNQRGNSCEGASTWACAKLAAIATGRDIEPSYTAIYALGRMLEDPFADRLADVGSYGYNIVAGAEQWGFVARSRWKDTADLTRPVTQDVLEAGSLAKVTGVYQIFETDPMERFALIEQANTAGFGVRYAQPVTDRYMDGPGKTFVMSSDPIRGWHSQAIVGYIKRAPGRPGRYKVKGSWGAEWNGDGHVWIHEDIVAEVATELCTLTLAPARLL